MAQNPRYVCTAVRISSNEKSERDRGYIGESNMSEPINSVECGFDIVTVQWRCSKCGAQNPNAEFSTEER